MKTLTIKYWCGKSESFKTKTEESAKKIIGKRKPNVQWATLQGKAIYGVKPVRQKEKSIYDMDLDELENLIKNA